MRPTVRETETKKLKVSRLTEHVEGDGGLGEADMVLAGRHLAAILPRVFLGDGVYGQRGPFHLGSFCISLWRENSEL